MPEKSLDSIIDHERWMMNNGIFTGVSKDNLFAYGAIIHNDIEEVECDIEFENKTIKYTLYFKNGTYRAIDFLDKHKNANNIFDLLYFWYILKRKGSIDTDRITTMLNKFVKDYCGPKWQAIATIKNIRDYKE